MYSQFNEHLPPEARIWLTFLKLNYIMRVTSNLPRIIFIIPSLEIGGAELFLIRLIGKLSDRIEAVIVVMKSSQNECSLLPLKNVPIYRMNLEPSVNPIKYLAKIFHFRKFVRSLNPDAIQCFLYPAELLSIVLGRKYPVFWSLRGSGNPKEKNWLKQFLILLNVFLSKYFPLKIIACSSAAREWGVSKGAPKQKIEIVNNFLAEWTNWTRSKSILLEAKSKISETGIRIGMAARFDPHKGHLNLLQGTWLFSKDFLYPVTLCYVGRDNSKIKLISLDFEDQILSEVKFSVEVQENISNQIELSNWFATIDLYVFASDEVEGFPNALAEAIAIGCPTLASPSGNSREMLSEKLIMPDNEPSTIGQAVSNLVNYSSFELREYIVESQSKLKSITNEKKVCDAYLNIWFSSK